MFLYNQGNCGLLLWVSRNGSDTFWDFKTLKLWNSNRVLMRDNNLGYFVPNRMGNVLPKKCDSKFSKQVVFGLRQSRLRYIPCLLLSTDRVGEKCGQKSPISKLLMEGEFWNLALWKLCRVPEGYHLVATVTDLLPWILYLSINWNIVRSLRGNNNRSCFRHLLRSRTLWLFTTFFSFL